MTSHKHFEMVCGFTKQYGILFTPDEITFIKAHTQHRVLPAHTILMEQGKRVDTLYFLNSGVARLYRIANGNDYTLGVASGNFFLSTPQYLNSGQISPCAIESLTEVDVLVWHKSKAEILRNAVARMYDVELAIMDRLLNWLQDNQIDAMCMTAEERYFKMLQTQPEIIQQIPLKYIASMLGIHPDSLSRIRKVSGLK